MTKQDADQRTESQPLPRTGVDAADGGRGTELDKAAFPIVGVGASAGGLDAFTQLLRALPAETGMAFVLVQHLAPTHASALAEILSRATKMSVTEVHDESPVAPNHVYVIPPGQNMVIANGALQLLPREGHGLHRPIDQFFRSLAEECGHLAIGVVLSGTASDGTLGLEAIKAEGGITFAQDATAQHEGMPHSAIASGCVDFELSPAEIAREIVRIGTSVDWRGVSGEWLLASGEGSDSEGRGTSGEQHGSAALTTGHSPLDTSSPLSTPSLATLLQLLRDATGVDFSHYKFNTLYRRVTRRMIFQKKDSLAEYVDQLRQTPTEVEALYQDILISVTSFFRDPVSFEALKATVFPDLLQDRSRHDPVRMWTLGCSTGQEAYSLAIAFMEVAEAAGSAVPFQLFATDLNPAVIEKARAGVFPKDIAQDISPERLQRFFTEVESGYRICKKIRDACIFSRHNVLADPPFSRIDMISCRNLLIYLEPVLQQRILPTLHYALKPAGFLWLGSSETIGSYRNVFEVRDAKHKIYTKILGTTPETSRFPVQSDGAPRAAFMSIGPRVNDGMELPREADRVLLNRFAPPGVLVTAELDILQYRGDTSPYLAPSPGRASLSLLKMLREGLLVAVRAAIVQAGESQATVREDGLRVKSDSGYRDVAIEVIPVGSAEQRSGEGRVASGEKRSGGGRAASSGKRSGGFLVLFGEAKSGEAKSGEAGVTSGEPSEPSSLTTHHSPLATPPSLATQLEQELAATREYLQSVIEQQEVVNEELQSANEEVQSANEELQSTNEELETSKEEVQSSNEELATVNDELNNRNAELHRVNDDLVNLLDSAQSPIVMLGPDLRVRRFTPAAESLLNLIPTDVGRPLNDIKLNLDNVPDLEPLLVDVLTKVRVKEFDVRDKHGCWHSLRLRPYRTADNTIDGVVVMLVNIDALKRTHALTESIVATVREPLLVLDRDLSILTASPSFCRTFQVTAEETVGRPMYELGNGQWDIPELRRLLLDVLVRDSPFVDFEAELEFEHLGRRMMILNARQLFQPENSAPSILLAIEDITDRRQAEASLHESLARFEALFSSSPIGMYLVDAEFRIRLISPVARPVFGDIPDLIGRDFDEVIHILWHADYANEIVQRFRHTLETGEPFQTPERIEQRLDRGVTEYYEWQIHRLALPDGQFGVVCHFSDISSRVRAEQSLRKNEERLRFVMDSMPQKIFTTTPEGDLDYFNPQWTEFTGMSFRQMTDSGWTRFVHPDDVGQKVRLWTRAFNTGEPFQSEHRFRRADGEYRWHFSRAVPMRDESGRVLMWIGTNTDVHDIKLTEQALQVSEMRYRRLFEAAKDGILILDAASQQITHVNPYLTELLDFGTEHFLGKELWEIGFLRDQQASRAAMQQLDEQGIIRYESLPLKDRQGFTHPVELVANVYDEGGHRVIQCNIRDITERRRLEGLLRGQASELSDLHRRKDEFLAMLSHELRSPLAPIANAVHLLGLHRGDESTIHQQARSIIERQLRQLHHLVDDLLEVSRITTGRVQLRLKRTAITEIVNNAIETVRPLIEQRRHELIVSLPEEPIWLNADAARLEQVVVNLLTNAAKYTEEGGQVELVVAAGGNGQWAMGNTEEKSLSSPAAPSSTAHYPLPTASFVLIRVRDNGIGIAPSLLPRIFDLFTQADRSLDRSQGGLGIGLALVQRLTELHGGTVEASSTLGQGSEFVVRLPLLSGEKRVARGESALLATHHSPLATDHSPLATQLKVLVVDDNADTVLTITMLLNESGHDVRTAADGPSGIQAALDFQPDVVLLDIGLPGLNGYEVAQQMRKEPDLQDAVLVALTGYGQDTDRQTSRLAGFNHHMVKPADFNKVQQILAAILEQRT